MGENLARIAALSRELAELRSYVSEVNKTVEKLQKLIAHVDVRAKKRDVNLFLRHKKHQQFIETAEPMLRETHEAVFSKSAKAKTTKRAGGGKLIVRGSQKIH